MERRGVVDPTLVVVLILVLIVVVLYILRATGVI